MSESHFFWLNFINYILMAPLISTAENFEEYCTIFTHMLIMLYIFFFARTF
eukprot:UN23963